MRFDSVFHLLYEMNAATVEKLFILPKINELFSKIGLKSKVGITHFTKYMKLCFNSLRIEKNEIHAFHPADSSFNFSGLTSFVLRECGCLIDWTGFDKSENNYKFYDKYKNYDNFPDFDLSKLNHNAEIIKDLLNMVISFPKKR